MVIQIKDLLMLKHKLIIRGYSQKRFANEIKVSASYVSLLLNGVKNPGQSVANRIAKSLQEEFDDLFYKTSDGMIGERKP